MELPADARAATASGQRWLIGTPNSARARQIARRHGARALRLPGTYSIAADQARALSAELRRDQQLIYAEPNVRLSPKASFDGQIDRWARAAVVPPDLPAPAAKGAVGIVDSYVDGDHPDLSGRVSYLPSSYTDEIVDGHGTMVASIVSGANNGTGVTGVFPGVPVVSWGLPEEFGCAEAADGVQALTDANVQVINLSIGGPNDCFTLYRAIMWAYGAGIPVVAASGNEFQEGNPVSFPAAFPHVLSVAAVDGELQSSFFSSENAAVDLAAPGEGIPVATPLVFDTDAVRDGVTTADGTSFAAPMVAAAAAWLGSARRNLDQGQVSDLLRLTATDLGPRGWDSSTGFGLLNLRTALSAPAPRRDPLEPNDDIVLVDGTAFDGADPPIWRGYGKRTISANVDLTKDPVDVYRITVPARAVVQVRMSPSFGDPDLEVFDGRARTVYRNRGLIGRSTRGEGNTDSVRFVNRDRRRRAFYLVAYVPEEAKFADAAYRLQVKRTRR